MATTQNEEAFIDDYNELLAERNAAIDLLRKYQWHTDAKTWWCPECHGESEEGHKTGCAVAKLLGAPTTATEQSPTQTTRHNPGISFTETDEGM